MKCLIINGPNLNMLGVREPDIYGTLSYSALCSYITQSVALLDVQLEFYQSNHEGDLVDKIQASLGKHDVIVINPAAYTHTSVAILDALKSVSLPAAEVHLSDVSKREAFRQISYAGLACKYHFIGEGKDGYVHAIMALYKEYEGDNK